MNSKNISHELTHSFISKKYEMGSDVVRERKYSDLFEKIRELRKKHNKDKLSEEELKQMIAIITSLHVMESTYNSITLRIIHSLKKSLNKLDDNIYQKLNVF